MRKTILQTESGTRRRFLQTALLTGALLLLPVVVFSSCTGKTSMSRSRATLRELGFAASGYPIVSKPYTLRVFAQKHQYTPDFNTLEIFQKLEAKTGVHIEWEYMGSDWSTQKPLLLAAQSDVPDVFMGKTLSEGDVVNNMDLFVPLDDLIAQYGTNIRAMLSGDPRMRNFARAYNGKIYGLPQQMPSRPDTFCVWAVNSTWLTKLNLKAPSTTEEFYQVLKAFKEKDPNGNGKADEIPASFVGGDQGNRGFMDLFGAFGIALDTSDLWLSVTNGRVQYIVAQDGFKDAVNYFHRLYAEDLIDKEVFTQDRNMYQAKANPSGNNPEIIGVGSNWARTTLWGVPRYEHYEVLLPLKGPGGHQLWRQSPELTKMAKYVFEITKACAHPEIALRWADALYDTATSLELFLGPLGTHVIANADGSYTQVSQPASFTGSHWIWNFALNDMAPAYVSDKVTLHLPGIEEQLLNDKKLLAPYFTKEYYPPVALSPDEINELAILRTDIHTAAREQFAKWVVGGGIEKEYEAFVRQLNAMGLPRMVQIYQTAYDRHIEEK